MPRKGTLVVMGPQPLILGHWKDKESGRPSSLVLKRHCMVPTAVFLAFASPGSRVVTLLQRVRLGLRDQETERVTQPGSD